MKTTLFSIYWLCWRPLSSWISLVIILNTFIWLKIKCNDWLVATSLLALKFLLFIVTFLVLFASTSQCKVRWKLVLNLKNELIIMHDVIFNAPWNLAKKEIKSMFYSFSVKTLRHSKTNKYFFIAMILLTRFLVCLSGWNFVIDFKLISRWARDLKFGPQLRCEWQWMKM